MKARFYDDEHTSARLGIVIEPETPAERILLRQFVNASDDRDLVFCRHGHCLDGGPGYASMNIGYYSKSGIKRYHQPWWRRLMFWKR